MHCILEKNPVARSVPDVVGELVSSLQHKVCLLLLPPIMSSLRKGLHVARTSSTVTNVRCEPY